MRVQGIKTLLKSCPQGHSTALVLPLVAMVTYMICLQHSGSVFPESFKFESFLFNVYIAVFTLNKLAVVSITPLCVLGFFKQTYGGQGPVNHSDSTQQQANKLSNLKRSFDVSGERSRQPNESSPCVSVLHPPVSCQTVNKRASMLR